jgi:hypothetical protein
MNMANIDEYVAGASIEESVRVIQLAHARLEQWERDIAAAKERAAATLAPARRKRTVQLSAGITAPAGDLDDEEVEAAQ